MSTNLVGNENLPNVYIKEITINSSARRFKISSLLHLYDIRKGSWYNEESVKNNMKIMVVLSSSESFNRSVVAGRGSLVPNHIRFIDGYNRDQVQFKVFPIAAVNRSAFDNELEDGHVVFPYSCSFRTKKEKNLSMFAVCFFDTKQFSSENAIDLSTRNVSSYHGAVVGEVVFSNGEVPSTTNMFTSGETTHTGPIHSHNGTPMAGSFHSASPHDTLNLTSTKNTKIKDYRISYKQKRRQRDIKRRKAIFSSLYTSVDETSNLRATFDIDVEQLYLQTSSYARLLQTLDKAMFQQALVNLTISDLKIYSQKARERLMNSKAGTRKVALIPHGRRRSVIGTKEGPKGLRPAEKYIIGEGFTSRAKIEYGAGATSGENYASPPVATIREVDIDHGSANRGILGKRALRTLCFVEENNRFVRGKNFYSVEVSYRDPSEDIIRKMFLDSKAGLSMLNNYKLRVERATNYNYHAKQSTSNLRNGTGQQAWMVPIGAFLDMYNLMFDTSDVNMEALVANLVIMLHPKTLTVKSVNWFCQQYSFVLNRMSRYFNNLNVSLSPKLKLGYVQKDPDKGKKKIVNTFSDVVDFSEFRSSVSFIPEGIIGSMDQKTAFPVLTYSEFRSMVRSERLRFFKSNPAFTADMVPYLKQSILTNLNNIDYAAYRYFSPTRISFGEKNTVDLSNLETVKLKEFNKTYRLTSQSPRKYIGFTPESTRQQNIKNGQKSSFHIKTVKREVEEIQEYTSSDKELGRESGFAASKKDVSKIGEVILSEETKERFQSFDRAKAGDGQHSIEKYDIKNQQNLLALLAGKKIPDSQKKRLIRDIPLHIKALLGSEHGFTKNNIFHAEGDLLKDTIVADLIKTCFLTLVKVQYLDKYHDNNLNDSKWKDMSSYAFNSLITKKKKAVLCRVVPADNSVYDLQMDFFDNWGLENQYFLVAPKKEVAFLSPNDGVVSDDGYINLRTQNDLEGSGKVSDMIQDFIKQSTLSSKGMDNIGCRTLVINQPTSKNGALKKVDYGISNDLVGAPPEQNISRQSSNASMQTSNVRPTSGGGGY